MMLKKYSVTVAWQKTETNNGECFIVLYQVSPSLAVINALAMPDLPRHAREYCIGVDVEVIP